MSDNKTPIQLSIDVFEKELREYNSFLGISNLPTDRTFWSGKIKATERAIQTLKSHLAIEEEAMIDFANEFEDFWSSTLNAKQYFNQKFKPE